MNMDPQDPALVAAANDAVDTAKTTIDWMGVTVTVPADLESIDPDAVEAIEDGKAVTFLRLAIGSKEYERARRKFQSVNHRPATFRDVTGDKDADSEASKNSLASLVAEHFGFTSGE